MVKTSFLLSFFFFSFPLLQTNVSDVHLLRRRRRPFRHHPSNIETSPQQPGPLVVYTLPPIAKTIVSTRDQLTRLLSLSPRLFFFLLEGIDEPCVCRIPERLCLREREREGPSGSVCMLRIIQNGPCCCCCRETLSLSSFI